MKKLVWLVYGIINKLKKFAKHLLRILWRITVFCCMFAMLDQNVGKVSHFVHVKKQPMMWWSQKIVESLTVNFSGIRISYSWLNNINVLLVLKFSFSTQNSWTSTNPLCLQSLELGSKSDFHDLIWVNFDIAQIHNLIWLCSSFWITLFYKKNHLYEIDWQNIMRNIQNYPHS